ncbi:HlyD family secretion protein [Nitrobacter sp.]|uniref:HlyD family secretion protein n=1 Tax=Nitrobacter sp. TaxID=29420 RepID=UPI0029CAAD26|nr:HlyD family secretion protein [Nitrobacter sp.]
MADRRSVDVTAPADAHHWSISNDAATRAERPQESDDKGVDKSKKQEKTPPSDKPSGSPIDRMRQHPIAIGVSFGLIVIGLVGGIIWYLNARHYESTDDAFIDARPVFVSPQVTGSLIEVAVTDNQIVHRGDLLARIDPRDYQAAVDQASAQIRQAEASARNLDAQIVAQQAQIEQAQKQESEAQAALKFAQDENKRYQDLVRTGAGTLQRAQQASSDLQGKQAAFDAAQAASTVAQRQIDVLNAQKSGALAQIAQGKAQKAQADANLQRTELRATVDGRVTKLTAAVGALAAPGQSIMIVVPLDVWVTANFKESQLANMKVGQPVTISIDAYGRSFPGHVNSIQAGSGTAFSLLPAENATGNYVKVVQRVPVKITFDQRPDLELGPGMSVVPTVTVRP